MAYLNSISIIGNLGHDAKFYTGNTNGTKKATFSVACTERFKDRDGETRELTQWFNVVAFGKLAETMERLSLTKGSCVYVGGKMTFRQYEKDGTKSSIAELVANTLQILTPRAQKAQEEAQGEASEEDDLPF